jgi:hypothetical protein
VLTSRIRASRSPHEINLLALTALSTPGHFRTGPDAHAFHVGRRPATGSRKLTVL